MQSNFRICKINAICLIAGETHHNKQESADSGLGMGSNFNLGSIPEDMGLETMDTADLDTTLTEGNQGKHYSHIEKVKYYSVRNNNFPTFFLSNFDCIFLK